MVRHVTREEIDGLLRRLTGAHRRMTIGLQRPGPKWRLDGHDEVKETVDAEVFANIGFHSRPPEGQGEALVAFVGGPNHACVVATRDEKTRADVAGDLTSDETATFNSQTIMKHTAAGEIEARSAAGAAAALARAAELADLRTRILTDVPLNTATTAGQIVTALFNIFTAWSVTGTTVLKGE